MTTSLDLIDHSSSVSSQGPETTEGSALVRLPGELIDDMLEMLSQRELLRVSFTCKRLNRHAQPILYRHIELYIPKGVELLLQFARHVSYSRSHFRETKTLTIHQIMDDSYEEEYHKGKGHPYEMENLGTYEWHVPFKILDATFAIHYVDLNNFPGITILNILIYKIVENLSPGRLECFRYYHTSPLGYQVLQQLAVHQQNMKEMLVREMNIETPLPPGLSVSALKSAIWHWRNTDKDVPECFAKYLGCRVWGIPGRDGRRTTYVKVPHWWEE